MAIRHTLTLGLLLVFAVPASAQVPNEFVSGTPALAAEVNENFNALDSQLTTTAEKVGEMEALLGLGGTLQNSYFPSPRYEPGFVLEIPPLAGPWRAFIQDQTHQAGTSARINLVSVYSTGNSFLGVYVTFAADRTAFSHSRGDNDFIYLFEIRAHDNFVFSNVNYTLDQSLEPFFEGTVWQSFATSEMIQSAVASVYEFFELTSGDTKACGVIDLHLNADLSVDATGSECVVYPGE